MSDGTNFILGQSNDAESLTRLRRFSHDDIAESSTKLEQVGEDVGFLVEYEGDCLLALGAFGTAIEGRTVDSNGVKGTSRTGPGVLGRSSIGPGVRGTSEGKSETPTTFALDSFGVDGVGRNGATGVRGMTTGVDPSTGNSGVAVHGIAVDGLPSLAGLFEGFVLIQGGFVTSGPALVTETLSAGAIVAQSKMFRIDHPLDPANKYLIHTGVESPDMKNVYDGLVTLDGQGEATVELPEWFESLTGIFAIR